jgi:hypothetical protein
MSHKDWSDKTISHFLKEKRQEASGANLLHVGYLEGEVEARVSEHYLAAVAALIKEDITQKAYGPT